MKKLIFLILMSAFCFSTSIVNAQNFKPIGKVYKAEFKKFLSEAFLLKKTGTQMDSTMRKTLNDVITTEFTSAFTKWGKFVIKNEGETPFKLKLKGTKGFETESEEYHLQFKKLQTEFINKRLIWKKDVVEAFLKKENLQPYVDAVIKKFEDTTKAKFQAMKP